MSLSRNIGKRDDVNNKVYDTNEFTISSGQELEAFTDVKEDRQWIRVVNKGPGRILVGPENQPKEELRRNQGKYWNHGKDLPIFVELSTGSSAVVFVEESG